MPHPSLKFAPLSWFHTANSQADIAITAAPSGALSVNTGPCNPVGYEASTCTFTYKSIATTSTPVTLSASLNSQNMTANVMALPESQPDLPCGVCQSNAQAGDPINLTNGDVWITEHDYSLPGLVLQL